MPKQKLKVTPPGPGGSVHQLVAMTPPGPGGLVLKELMESHLILKISSPILVQFWEKMETKNTVKTVVEQHIVTFWAPGGRN